MFTVTADLMLPSTVTGSWPRPRWFDVSMWGKPLDTCMMDVRFREKFQDALAVVISDEERAGLDILTHGDFHCDEDLAGRSWHHYPLQRWAGLGGRLSAVRGDPLAVAQVSAGHAAERDLHRLALAAGGRTRSSTGRWTTPRSGAWPRPRPASRSASAPAARR